MAATCASMGGSASICSSSCRICLRMPERPSPRCRRLNTISPPSECFAMRHVQVSMISPRRLFAVLRPLAPGGVPLAATVVDGVLRIQGEGVDDTLFLFCDPARAACGDVRFAGRYGAVLKRPRHTTLVLLDGETIACGAAEQEAIGEMRI